MGFPGGIEVKSLPAKAGDTGLIPGSGRSPGEGSGNLLQYSCQENFCLQRNLASYRLLAGANCGRLNRWGILMEGKD